MEKINEKRLDSEKEDIKNISMVVIPIVNPKGKWIGNVAINTETMEVIDNLRDEYRIEEAKPPAG